MVKCIVKPSELHCGYAWFQRPLLTDFFAIFLSLSSQMQDSASTQAKPLTSKSLQLIDNHPAFNVKQPELLKVSLKKHKILGANLCTYHTLPDASVNYVSIPVCLPQQHFRFIFLCTLENITNNDHVLPPQHYMNQRLENYLRD